MLISELAAIEPDSLLRLWRYLHSRRNSESVLAAPFADRILLAAVTRELLIRRLL